MSESPPSNHLAENAVVSAIYLEPSLLPIAVTAGLRAEHFFHDVPHAIYSCMLAIKQDGGDITLPSIFSYLARLKLLDTEADEAEVTEVLLEEISIVGFESNVKLILEAHKFRGLITTVGKIAKDAYSPRDSFVHTAASAYADIRSLIEPSELGILSFRDITISDLDGPAWGLAPLDNNTYGIVGGELTVLAGGTGDGKSMVAGQIVRTVSTENHSVIFTLEMTGAEWKRRAAHALARVPMRTSKFGELPTDEQVVRLMEAEAQLDNSKLSIIPRPGIRLDEVIAIIDILSSTNDLKLVVIDYLQLMDMTNLPGTEAEKIGHVTSRLKRVAMDFNVHVLLISQFSRSASADARYNVSERVDCLFNSDYDTGKPLTFPVPNLAHLKGSSSIEQDADRVVLLQNHSYSTTDDRPYTQSCRSHLEIFIAKQRNGLSGGHGTVVKEYWQGSVRQYGREEMAQLYGAFAVPVTWLRDQGYSDGT